jgi:hypothetical protein
MKTKLRIFVENLTNMISAKFGSNWPSSFILSKCEMLSMTIDGCIMANRHRVMAIADMTL